MKERGKAITNEKWDKLVKINSKLTKLAKTKYSELTTPTSAFVTMHTEDGKRSLYNQVEVCILGHKCHVKKAKAPNDVIWENQEAIVRWGRARKLFLLVATLLVFLKLTNYLVDLNSYFERWEHSRYDMSFDCTMLR